jgi:hypothetical protein
MGREDWYRNKTWDSEIERAFLKKLGRARDKAQYLRIQGCILAPRYPDIALELLAQYFALGEHFDFAQAYVDQATAYGAKKNIESALASLESALHREITHPNLLTQAYLEFPRLVALHRLSTRYPRALDVLAAGESRLTFPADRYVWNGARALILHDQGHHAEARTSACSALEAAAENHSGFQYHPQVGVVRSIDDEFGDRLSVLTRARH